MMYSVLVWVGGGLGSYIGQVHRKGATFDEQARLVRQLLPVSNGRCKPASGWA